MTLNDIATLLVTLAVVLGLGVPVRFLLRRIGLPPAVSLMALGVLLGGAGLALLPEPWLDARSTFSKAAFVVLLLRAGLGIPPRGLRTVVLFAIALGTIPVAAELGVVATLSRAFLFAETHVAVLAGFLIAAASPAVILPTMLNRKDLGQGAARLVPDRLIGQTVVNALVAQTGILMMLDFIAPKPTGVSASTALMILPLELAGGVLVGLVAGSVCRVERIMGAPPCSRRRLRAATAMVLLTGLAVYFGCSRLPGLLGFDGLFLESVFATLAIGVAIRRRAEHLEPALRIELRGVWSLAEIVLFVNLGSAVDLTRLAEGRTVAIVLGIVAVALAVRLLVAVAMLRLTPLVAGERS